MEDMVAVLTARSNPALGRWLRPWNVPQREPRSADNAVGVFQAEYMAEKLWTGFWGLALLNGFWILFSTQLGNTDVLTRVCTDALWAGWPGLRRFGAGKIYFALLMLFSLWGVGALWLGDSGLSLFKILGLLASPILAIGAVQILRVNLRFLPAEVRPPLWRCLCLAACAVVYTGLAALSLWQYLVTLGLL
jgi:hypothetical protein